MNCTNSPRLQSIFDLKLGSGVEGVGGNRDLFDQKSNQFTVKCRNAANWPVLLMNILIILALKSMSIPNSIVVGSVIVLRHFNVFNACHLLTSPN